MVVPCFILLYLGMPLQQSSIYLWEKLHFAKPLEGAEQRLVAYLFCSEVMEEPLPGQGHVKTESDFTEDSGKSCGLLQAALIQSSGIFPEMV